MHLDKAKFFIKTVDQKTALELIERWHYAKGGPRTAVFRHGLFGIDSPDEPLGVALWLPPTKVAAQSVAGDRDWRGVLSLSRLVVAPDMPTNTASYLMGRSIRLVKQDPRWHTGVTYADTGQGHTGAIYLATNWTKVGMMPGNQVWKDANGRQVSKKNGARSRTSAEMRELGYEPTGKTNKIKFIIDLS
jgi:hypothetical protein